jgi:putative transposase
MYLDRTPVRANMVKHPIDYPWSSYAANARSERNEGITPHAEYLGLGSMSRNARRLIEVFSGPTSMRVP